MAKIASQDDTLDSLAQKFKLSKEAIQIIRTSFLTQHNSLNETLDMMHGKIKRLDYERNLILKRRLKYESIINFLSECSPDDLLEVTRK